jgi:hypothetical protein
MDFSCWYLLELEIEGEATHDVAAKLSFSQSMHCFSRHRGECNLTLGIYEELKTVVSWLAAAFLPGENFALVCY